MRPVVVHGGGPQISDLMDRLGKEPEFRDGLRVTDAETARHRPHGARRQGQPRASSSAINVHGPLAVGRQRRGRRAHRGRAARRPGLGFVGDVAAVNPAILERLLAEDLIPVIATIGADEAGQAYNINADTVAGAIAEALGAEKLVYLTDVEGCSPTSTTRARLISQITRGRARRRSIADGTLTGGMIPKIAACVARGRATASARAHILDGRIPHVLLLELFTDDGHRHDDACHEAMTVERRSASSTLAR